ncbi:A/G-specific adenine DNA glycosylase [Termitomyces sp. J132]|nr:A/G-specific adenine DNA glycosylase [Termitomyces sp. J132]
MINDDHSTSDYDSSESHSGASSYQNKRKRKASTRKNNSNNSQSLLREPVQSVFSGDAYPHTSSSHVIISPGALQDTLLEWYGTVQAIRGMPWRKPYNPYLGPEERSQRAYEIWVSEIMLQQTQVTTVIPYYMRWMEMYPTVRDLATADIDEVNALWKGLGYYSRASRLLAGAQKVVANYHGMLPVNARDLEANIPGIGRYSAGAIASIAYGEHVPIVHGNVHRLLSRFLAVYAPPKAKATLDILWAAAAAMVDFNGSTSELLKYPGDINQALIELGSTICRVRDPSCDACPLRPWCRAYELSRPGYMPAADIEDVCSFCEPLRETNVTTFPMKMNRKKPREELDIVNVIEWTSSMGERWFLMVRRPDRGLLAGLYEFPTTSNVARTTSTAAQAKIPLTVLGKLLKYAVLPYDLKNRSEAHSDHFMITTIKPASDVLHVFSHIKKTYRPQWVVVHGGESPPPLKVCSFALSTTGTADSVKSHQPNDALWVRLEDVPGVNMGTGVAKVWKTVEKLWR